jgi:hypothetical protein
MLWQWSRRVVLGVRDSQKELAVAAWQLAAAFVRVDDLTILLPKGFLPRPPRARWHRRGTTGTPPGVVLRTVGVA